MTREKLYFKNISIALAVISFAMYLFAVYFNKTESISKISAAINFGIAFVILVQIISNRFLKSYWLLIPFAIVAWGCADIAFALSGAKSMSDYPFLYFLYTIPVLIFFISFTMILLYYFKFLDITQIIIDIGTVLATTISFLMSILFNESFVKDVSNIRFLYNIFYLFIDVFIFSMSFFILFSIKRLPEYRSFYMLVFAMTMYAFYDILYSFGNINGYNFENNFGDAGFIIIFMVMMLASFYISRSNIIMVKEDAKKTIVKKTIILLVIPMIKIALGMQIHYLYITIVLAIALFYATLTFHISMLAESKNIFEDKKRSKERLEELIKKRLIELEYTSNKLSKLSRYDHLTKAYNRPYFLEKLTDIIKTKDIKENINVYNINISRFKSVNDTYGHYTGDEVLIKLVENLKDILPKGAIIGRFSGDSVFIATKVKTASNDYTEFCTKLLRQVRVPINVEGTRIHLNAKIGVSITYTSQIKTDDLIVQSQEALLWAKESISSSYVVYDDKISKKNLQRRHIEILLENADFEKEFSLAFQPQYEIEGRQLVGVEALLRWNSPVKGVISPGVFIPIAEESSMIIKIGNYVSKTAMAKIADLNKKFNLDLKVSINISPRQIDDIKFVDKMLDCIKESGVNPKHICFEITEMSLMESEELMREVLLKFQKNNIDIAIDDFGTGFSSLSYIKKYDISKLKIAKELIDNIENSKADRDVISAIITLAKNLNIKSIAEGVETDDQLQFLRMMGCDEIQGYIWGKPLNEKQFEILVRGYASLM